MSLPERFRFTQQSLQDYVDCRRRFQLRYVLMQPWPALVTAAPGEYEAIVERGADFHRLAHQHALGFDVGQIEATIDDEELRRWWRTFLAHPPAGVPETVRRAEVVLSAPMPQGAETGGHRLVAKIDLLAAEPGERIVVVDWKTMRRRPRRDVLARRLQTRVYRYLAAEAGTAVNGGVRPQAEQIEMVYWFAAHDGQVERFRYDAEQHAADRAVLAELAAEAGARDEAVWPLTEDLNQCRVCAYRSLCERQVEPAFPDELPDDVEVEALVVDLEQVAEVAF